MCPKPREYHSRTSASAASWSAVRTPCGILTRTICASAVCRWPYVPRTRRNARHLSGASSPRSKRSSVATNSSISAVSANERRVRPNVVGSSTTDIDRLLWSVYLPCLAGQLERRDVADHDRRRAVALDLRAVGREVVEPSSPSLLTRRRSLEDHGRRRPTRPASIDQLARQRSGSSEAHQDHERRLTWAPDR